MFKKILLAATVVLLVGVAIASAYPWEAQKKVVNVFKRNLAGTAPTAVELSTNFVQVGDFVIDTSNSDSYQVINRNVPSFVKVSSNGTMTVSGVVADSLYSGGNAGISRVITNQGAGFTNKLLMCNGVVTNFSYNPVP